MTKTLNAECFCGEVRLKINGVPEAMGYCHCDSCRHWSAGPVNAFSLWAPANIEIIQGQHNLQTYTKTENSLRKWCGTCGGHVMTEHPKMNLTDVYSAVIHRLEFNPSVHVFYSEKRISMPDGLPKFSDMPKEMGGSGKLLPE
ncbi:MAG: aldehyde-activating protein [Methylococcaceae bacterium TMED69]|nr:MAG: aldehyde-activating protein [Methylococcaceae bacterium TMED69]